MWTNENRGRYDRSLLRYPSDLTDDEWNLVECLIPPGKRGGDKRTVIMREVVRRVVRSSSMPLIRRGIGAPQQVASIRNKMHRAATTRAGGVSSILKRFKMLRNTSCLLYTSDAADE